MSDRISEVEAKLGVPLSELAYLIEGLESVEQTLTGISCFESATIVFTITADETDYVVTAKYADRRWLVLL